MGHSRYRHDPEGHRLPIKLDHTSNGEFVPPPLTSRDVAIIAQAQADASDNARRRGLARRAYMLGNSAAAGTLLAINTAARAQGRTGGYYDLDPSAGTDEDAATAVLGGNEFIFDVQNHAINPNGPWRTSPGADKMIGQLKMAWSVHNPDVGGPDGGDDEYGYLNFMDGDHYVKDMFLDSDTHTACMSVQATNHEDKSLRVEDADMIRTLVERLGHGRRLLIHGKALPNFPGDFANMEELAKRWKVAAWKIYTQIGTAPDHVGYDMDDPEVMTPFVEKSRALGINIICAHKGLPYIKTEYARSTCRDIGGAAKLFPDMNILVYHAGYEMGRAEGSYDPNNAAAGIDALVKSVIDNGIAPNTNVYAELGAIWRMQFKDPEQGAHCWGKLLKYIGEDNVMWGTDCTWAGSPQDQIQAFRAFQISEEFQERYGYPKLTPALKTKIFGLNAARVYGIEVPDTQKAAESDEVAKAKRAYQETPDPSFASHGPKTPEEYRALKERQPNP